MGGGGEGFIHNDRFCICNDHHAMIDHIKGIC